MKRTKVSLSNYKLFSGNMGDLIPIECREVLPGDTWQHATSALVRMSPLLAPVMHPLRAQIYHFFVPYRLCWENWEDFITGGPDNDDASVFPTINFAQGTPLSGTLGNYLGVRPSGLSGQPVSALPFRAYGLIYNEWFRDQDLIDPLDVSLADGTDSTTNTTLQKIAWEKDRFTTCRPWPQKGAEISIPMSPSAPVVGNGENVIVAQSDDPGDTRTMQLRSSGNSVGYSGSNFATGDDMIWSQTGMDANLEDAAGTIRELREAIALQRFNERMARAGSRYTEYLKSSFGVRSSDARLQRPELLGTGNQVIQFSEVLQTAPNQDSGTSEDNGVGALKGHGIGSMRSNRYRRFFEEHGVVISLFALRPKSMYVQGQEKMWFRSTKEDFYDKDLALIGEEPLYNREVFAAHTSQDGIFGYQQRYYDYRSALNSVAGEFDNVLNYWHMARSFESDVALNDTFVKCDPTNRIFASTDTDQFYVMAHHSIQARRPIHRSSNPRIL